jgi:pimeloyl-[acyl-carrier protein] synthase
MATTTMPLNDTELSLHRLLDPEVLANPYPLYKELRDQDPVHWDPFLHAWVVTRYEDVLHVLMTYSANRTPTPEYFEAMGMSELSPIAGLMVRLMLFQDGSAHTRLRSLCACAFTPGRIAALRQHIQDIADRLIDEHLSSGRMEIIGDFAGPLPSIVTCEMLGVPTEDSQMLRGWSGDFAEMLGNFQHNPERSRHMIETVNNMTEYFQREVRAQQQHPRPGLVHALITAETDGMRLTEDEIVASLIVTMVGGQETTTNLIGNGLVSLLRNPDQLELLRNDKSIIAPAVEELLRYESPSQQTARLAFEDVELGGKKIRKRQAVIAVMAAGNRDPRRFPDPDRLDLRRTDNRHLAFGWAAHYCFGAPLARMEGQIAFETLLRRLPELRLEPQEFVWRTNLGLRGLKSLDVSFDGSRS